MPVLLLPLAARSPSWVFVLFLIAGAAAIGIALWSDRKRGHAMRLLAKTHGWHFSPGPDRHIEDRYPHIGRLQQGHSRRATNLIRGSRNGRDLTVFDYRYVTGSGKQRKTHRFTGVILDAGYPLDPLSIRHENVFDQVTAAFGFDDIDFESTEFSRRFHVTSPRKQWAYTVVNPEAMRFLLDARFYPIELGGREAFAWGAGRLAPSGIRDAILLLEGILDRIPPDVQERRRGGHATT